MSEDELIAAIEAQGYSCVSIDTDRHDKWVEGQRPGGSWKRVGLYPYFRVTPDMLWRQWQETTP